MASSESTGSAVYDTVECAVNNDERGLGCGVGCGVGCRFIKSYAGLHSMWRSEHPHVLLLDPW